MSPQTADITLELERFVYADGVFSIAGRWRAPEPAALGRARLCLVVGGRRRRLNPVENVRVQASPEGVNWHARFTWTGGVDAVASAEVEVGRALAVELPAPEVRSEPATVVSKSVPAPPTRRFARGNGKAAPPKTEPESRPKTRAEPQPPAPGEPSERERLDEALAQLAMDREKLEAALAELAADRELLAADRQALASDREALAADREVLAADREELTAAREQLAADRAKLDRALERLDRDRSELERKLAERPSASSPRTAPPPRRLAPRPAAREPEPIPPRVFAIALAGVATFILLVILIALS